MAGSKVSHRVPAGCPCRPIPVCYTAGGGGWKRRPMLQRRRPLCPPPLMIDRPVWVVKGGGNAID